MNDKIALMKKLQAALKQEGKLYSTVPSMVDKAEVEELVGDFLKYFQKRLLKEEVIKISAKGDLKEMKLG